MKHLTSLLLLTITWSVSAQCDADFDFMGAEFGISPDPLLGETFAIGVVDQPYVDVIHMMIPASTSSIPEAPIELPMDSVVVDSISLIGELGEYLLSADIGLSMYPNNNGDSPNPSAFYGGNQYCVSLEGTPDTVGLFTGAIHTTAWVTIPFLGANAIPFPYEGFTLIINGNGTIFCEDPAACNFVSDEPCDFTSCLEGCMNNLACNFDPEAQIESGDCLFYDALNECGGNCIADDDQDGVCDDADPCVGLYDPCGICNGPGPVYECGCNAILNGDCDCEGNQVDVIGVCGGQCQADSDNNGVCDDQEVYGCSYPLAENFSSSVTRDDGSCIFPCEGVVNINVFDWDEDYAVTIADFLAMLSVFGDVDVDSDGVWDSSDLCVDINACNYANAPSEPCGYIDVLGICGGGCEADEDSDGICDDIDACIGVEDECGVCNGPGPTEVVIEDITILYDSVYAEPIDQWFVFEVGADTTFSFECAPSFSACGAPVSHQGYDYATVLIGEQCWFAENLRSENYANGDVILSNLSDNEWYNTSSGAVTVFGAGPDCDDFSPDGDACDESWSLSEYGRLYNWLAVDDSRGLCPSGWHVPSDGEWMTLEMALGMSEVDANDNGWRGTDQGDKMKTDYGWSIGSSGTNSSGFSALPGGYRNNGGGFYETGEFGGWWSSSPNGIQVSRSRILRSNNANISRGNSNPLTGFSVRCIQTTDE